MKRYLLSLACLVLPCCVFAASDANPTSTTTPTTQEVTPSKKAVHHHKKGVRHHKKGTHHKKVIPQPTQVETINNVPEPDHHPHRAEWANYNEQPPVIMVNPNHFEVIGAAGIASINQGNTYLGVTSSETDKLVQTNNNRWNTGVFQAGAGFVYYFPGKQRFSCCRQWFPSIEPELNYYYSPNHIKGDVYRFSDPALNELTYKTTVDTSRLMLDAALTVISQANYSLFVIGGIGEAWSKVNYSDTVNGSNPCVLSAITLNNRNQTNFVWEAGVGVAYILDDARDRYNVSLEYLYTDFGSLKLPGTIKSASVTEPQITPASFKLRTQAILLGLHVALS